MPNAKPKATLSERLLYSSSTFGPWSEYTLETREAAGGGLVYVLEGDLPEAELPRIATQIRARRRLGRQIVRWVQRQRTAASEACYQSLGFDWDGERYTRMRRGAILNEAAFLSALH